MNELKLNPVEAIAASSSSASKPVKAEQAAKIHAQSGKELPVTSEAPEIKLSAEQMQDAVSRINEYVQQSERKLDFRLDEDSGQTIIRVYDKNSDELIRQIPGELALRLAQQLNDEEPSLLFKAQV